MYECAVVNVVVDWVQYEVANKATLTLEALPSTHMGFLDTIPDHSWWVTE